MVNKKQQQLPIEEKFLLVGTVIAFGIFLVVPSAIPAHGFHKETALLKKYNSLEDLVNDIKNGKVDFKDFRDSDGIDLTVMKDSEIYDEADTTTKDCIDFAGKVGNSLGDREIVHCSEDPNYFKTKYSSNSSVSASGTAPLSIGSAVKKSDNVSSSSSADSASDKNDLIEKLVKTGQFTVQEAKEFVSKNKQVGNRNETTQTSNANDSSTIASDTETSRENEPTSSTKPEDNNNNVGSSNSPDNPEDYKDLGQLVHDIKNGDLDADRISLKAFQNSGAYKGADEQIQACIDFAGKVGKNLDDSEIVHCSEDTNYFKNKYSSSGSSSAPVSSNISSPSSTGKPSTDTNAGTGADSTASSRAQTESRSSSANINKNILIEELVKSGKFTENEATEFAIVHELVNKQKFTEKEAVDFAKKIMQVKNQMTSAANSPSTVTRTDTDTDTNPDDDSEITSTNTNADKTSSNGNHDSSDNLADSKADNPEDYKDLGRLVHDIKNGDLDADRISLKAFQNSGAYKGVDEQTQACIDRAGKVGKNLDDSEIVHCSEDPNNFKK